MKFIPPMPAETPELPYSCSKCGEFIFQEEIFRAVHDWHMIHGFLQKPHQIPIRCEHCGIASDVLCTPLPHGSVGQSRRPCIASTN
jgi:hypothetical protein